MAVKTTEESLFSCAFFPPPQNEAETVVGADGDQHLSAVDGDDVGVPGIQGNDIFFAFFQLVRQQVGQLFGTVES